MGQIKCYNIKYSVEEEDLLANPKFKSIDDLHNSLPKQVIIDHDVKLEIDEIIVNAISDQTGWLVEGFNWKVEEEQRPTESDNTLDQFFVNE
tara:strand:+ start:7 stop:282 length:276 start_codon:yes stop_codon:yes gene_type:complete